MRYPKHIILDVSKPNLTNTSGYWVNKYRSSFTRDEYFNTSLNVIKSLSPSLKSRASLRTSTTSFRTTNSNLSVKILMNDVPKEASLLWTLFDINFLKREKLYTKLKYSRSPAYDIVSGGVAALFAGFIGSLISEKFGIELVDSGDFYTFFMYTVFLCFSLRPLIKILSKESTLWNFASPKFLTNYFYTLVVLLLRSITKLISDLNKKLRSFKLYIFYTVWGTPNPSSLNSVVPTFAAKLMKIFNYVLPQSSNPLHIGESDDELRPFTTLLKNSTLFFFWLLLL